MSWTAQVLKPLRKLRRRFWISFLLACVLAEGGEHLFERILASGNEDAAESVLGLSGVYQHLVSAGRMPRVRNTAVLEINPRVEFGQVSSSNVCGEREFLAHLLKRIDLEAEPAVIVVDKWFGLASCAPDDPGTRDLINAVKGLRHKFIAGLQAAELTTASPDGYTNFVDQSLDFNLPDERKGLVNISEDSRRLPLQWSVLTEDNPRSPPKTVDTLSLAAARAFDPGLLSDKALSRLIADGEQPYIGFLGPGEWKVDGDRFYAGQVICGAKMHPDQDWKACEGNGSVPPQLAHRIVIIGENNSNLDSHRSVVGAVPGVYLQANYIEALLDTRYLKPASAFWDYAAGFCFLFVLELILSVWHEKVSQTVLLITVLLTVSYVVLYLTVVTAHYYVDPVPVGATAVAIKILHSLSEEVIHSGSEHNAGKKKSTKPVEKIRPRLHT